MKMTGMPLSVLMVDTNVVLLESTKQYLEHNGDFIVDLATSDDEVRNKLNNQHYDVIVSDEKMPDVEGISFFSKLKNENDTFPLIPLSCGNREELVALIIQTGKKKRTRTARREHEKLMTEIISSLPDPTFAVDLMGRVILWNKAMEEMTGVPADEILGQNNYAYSLPFSHGLRPLLIDSVLQQDPDLLVPYENIRHVGNKIHAEISVPGHDDEEDTYVRITAAPFYDTDGMICGAIETIKDITDRKKAELILAESEGRYRDLFTHMIEGSALHEVIVDASGTPVDYRILEVNETFEKLLGLSRDQVLGKTSREAYQVDEPPYLDTYASIAFGGESQTFETFFAPMDKYFKIAVYSPKNGIFVTIFEDITRRRQMEERLQQVTKKLKLMSQITRHDIINKVAGILLYIEVLQANCSDDEQYEILEHIAQAAEEINKEITFARMYEEIGSNEPVWQRLQDVLTCGKASGGITLTCDIIGIEILADAMLGKVFYNLLDNAIRHGKNVSEVHVTYHEAPDGLVIVWEDNGRGVPLSMKEKIFEREVGDNTGLGLFLAREILAITNISIEETGTEESGARFEIVVPVGGYQIRKV